MTATGRIPALDRLGPLGFGAATLGNLYEPMTDEQADATVATAWAAGIRYFDTAPHYGLGLSERRLGQALVAARCSRTDTVISTKVGRLIEDGYPPRSDRDSMFAVTSTARRTWDFSAGGVRRSLDDSLERLGLDRVDIALVHDPDDHVDAAINGALPALCRLRDEGVVAAVGVGVNDADLAAHFVTASDLDVVLIAGRYTLLDQRAARTLLPACVARGVAVIAAAPFNSGLLSSAQPSAGAMFDYAAAPPAVVARATDIATVCAEHGVELPEAALRFPLQHPAVATVLAGCRTPDEVNQNAARVAAANARESGAWDGLWAELPFPWSRRVGGPVTAPAAAAPPGIVDSHHHLWDPARSGSEWLQDGSLERINRAYGLADLGDVTGRNGVSATVLVQTIADLDESVELCAVAAESGGLIAGVVGWVDLTSGDAVGAQVERLRAARGGDRLVGIRHLVQSEADREWLRRDDVVAGIAAVGRAGLVFDLLVLTDQLASAVALVSLLDDVAFVLDHAAKPPFGSGAEQWSTWREGVAELADRPNVVCKLSGLVTEADWWSWDADTLRPAADHVLDVFGADRVLFGSDWPVCELAGSYDEVLGAARDLAAGCSEAERAEIFGANARRVYGI